MLSRRTLPLFALRAFESAGRHLHFQKAGHELGVTPSAISHQIRNLESQLEVRLFERSGNRLALTPAGRLLLEKSSDAFNRLIDATEQLGPDTVAGKLTIGCTTTLLISLLLNTISRFRKTYPEIELEVIEIKPLQEDIPRSIDLAFCYGEPKSTDRQVEALMRENTFPVASPGLLQTLPRITRPVQMLKLPLLYSSLGHWNRWLSMVGLSHTDVESHLRFFNTHVTHEAARRGLGVALATHIEVHDDLRRGTLVKVLEKNMPEPHQYYLVTNFSENQTNRAILFERWLRDELQELYQR
jgi:LysR family glycine cleavage system transcriptional activator